MKRVSIYLKLLIFFVLFLAVAYFVRGVEENKFIETILGAASFIFGVILAFSTANRHSRLSSIREKLREQDAILLNIYMLAKEFDKRIVDEVRRKIDCLLVSQIDYKLVDFDRDAPKKLKELYLFVEKIRGKTENQKEAAKKMLDNLSDLLKIQEEVSYQVKNRMMGYEWISLLILGAIILFCLFYINTNTLVSILVISVLSTALVLLLLVLQELNSLQWQEHGWIWGPLSNLFSELDLVPYFPDAVFKQGRLKIQELEGIKKIRVAHYPKPYPDMDGKKVEIARVSLLREE